MEFDWLDAHFNLKEVSPKEIEESFEDPFALKLLPEGKWAEQDTRFFCLGKSLNNRALISLFWTDGKKYRVIHSREMEVAELNFYERKNATLN